jgi:FkbM family methyltransferase
VVIDIGKARYPLRILWSSNGAHTPTGYGNQTALAVPRLAALGHTMGLFAWYGLEGAALTYGFDYQGQRYPVTMYPRARDGYGNDMVAGHAAQFKADIILSLIDAWVLEPAAHGGAQKWCPWFPIDAWPIPGPVLEKVRQSLQPIVYSRFGERMAHDAGLDVRYVPHGVDTAAFRPGEQAAAREKLGIPPDRFVVLMVAANKDNPSRKAYPAALHAFAHLARKHPDAHLYLHTVLRGGTDLEAILDHLELRGRASAANQYAVITGAHDSDHMATLYQAADVLLSPSFGEGFGIPILEAQACGLPVIVGDWSSMSELCFAGWKIPQPADAVDGYGPVPDPWWNPLGAYWQQPRVGAILEALEAAYQARSGAGWPRLQSAAREGATAYDADLVARDYWRPVLDEIGERVGVQPAAAGAYLDPELWSRTGLYDADGALCLPSRDPKSAAALRLHRDGRRTVDPGGWPMDAGGIPLDIEDDPWGGVAKIVCREIVSAYGLDDLDLQPGDVALDLGAHVGVVSSYLLRRYPGITLYAVEPQPANVARYQRNLQANAPGAAWTLYAGAVTGDGRPVAVTGDLGENSGGSDIYHPDGAHQATVESRRLVDIARGYERIALLKVDIEGAEYEVLRAAVDVLPRVDVIAIELHERPGVDGRAFVAWLVSFGCEVRLNGRRYRRAASEVAV